MKIFQYILPLFAVMALLTASEETLAQCRPFTKNKVLPLLEGYVQNENYNSAMLIPGDEAEVLMTFYANKEYRLVVAGAPVLPEVEWEIRDTNDQLIYSNKQSTAENKGTFDFKMSSTQQLIIRIRVPKEQSVIPHEGCVVILAGHKA
jgi:hypothetical protein